MKRLVLLPILVCALNASAAESPLAGEKPRPGYSVEFALADQNEQTHTMKFPRAKISVLVLADQAGSKQIEGWIAPLYARYEKRIAIAGVADLPGIPPTFHGLFRREFKKKLLYPVMLDWSGDVARAFGYQKQKAELLVIGMDGRIAFRKTGAADEPGLAAAYQAIDRLLAVR